MEDAEGDVEKAAVDTYWVTRVSGAGLCGKCYSKRRKKVEIICLNII